MVNIPRLHLQDIHLKQVTDALQAQVDALPTTTADTSGLVHQVQTLQTTVGDMNSDIGDIKRQEKI